jgi:hypothetical protein
VAVSNDQGRTFRVLYATGSDASLASDYGDQLRSAVAANGNSAAWYYESNREAHRVVQLSAVRDGGAGLFRGRGGDHYALNSETVYSNTESPAFRMPMDPHMAWDGEDRFVMAYVKATPRFNGFESEIRYLESDTPTSVLTSAGNPRTPKVAAANGTSAVVYSNNQSTSDANHDVVAWIVTNGRWRVFNLSRNHGYSSNPQVVVSGNNYVVVWTDTTPGNSDIFFRAIPYR